MITLGVIDLEMSVKFYREDLGYPEMGSQAESAFFTPGGSRPGLHNPMSPAEDTAGPADGSGFNGHAPFRIVALQTASDLNILSAQPLRAQLSSVHGKTDPGEVVQAASKIRLAGEWETACSPRFPAGRESKGE